MDVLVLEEVLIVEEFTIEEDGMDDVVDSFPVLLLLLPSLEGGAIT